MSVFSLMQGILFKQSHKDLHSVKSIKYGSDENVIILSFYTP